MNGPRGLLRTRSGQEHARVEYVELFFDLVFVFAITQLSHLLLENLSPIGALQTAVLLMAVWWAWIDTSWVTNWLDPNRPSVRLMLFVLMLAGLTLSAGIPEAFEINGLTFACAYAFIQVGRSLFMLWALQRDNAGNFRNFQRITAWHLLIGALWIAGAFLDGERRLTVWALAMLIETAGPALGFWTPGWGRSIASEWDVDGDHMAERCALFVIIALGESILVTGSTASKLPLNAETGAAFFAGFVGSVAMWWIYFNLGAQRGRHLIATSADPGRLARLAYTYVHVIIVAGIIVCAVSDEIVLQHPHGAPDIKSVTVIVGGPALFLLGTMLFKWCTAGWPPLSHLVGLAALVAMLATLALPAHMLLSPLSLGALTSVLLAIVAAWETWSLGGNMADVH